jgi:hypothetical protein
VTKTTFERLLADDVDAFEILPSFGVSLFEVYTFRGQRAFRWVRVLEIDEVERRALVIYNSSTPEWFSEERINKLQRKEPRKRKAA